MIKRTSSIVASALLFSSPALAETAAPNATVEGAEPAAPAPGEPVQHQHVGLFLRAELGGGFRSMSTGAAGSLDVSGAGPGFSLAAGAPVADNLILLGELVVEGALNPTIKMGSLSVDTKDASFTLTEFGPGITYYFMPANVHVGATLFLTRATLTYKGEDIAKTDLGFGGLVRVGKDFWIGKNLGLGLAGHFSFASMKDNTSGGGSAPTWSALAGTLALEGTYN